MAAEMNPKDSQATLEWSSPERRFGDKELPLIANEIYIDIITYFDPPKDQSHSKFRAIAKERKKVLGNLALVCRFFHFVSLPLMFEVLASQRRIDQSSGTLKEDYIPLLRSVSSGTDPLASTICSQIRKVYIDVVENPASPARPYVKTCAAALSKMPNVTTLMLSRLLLTGQLLESTSQLSNLTSLNLYHCDISPGILAADVLALASSVKLESLSLMFPYNSYDHEPQALPVGIHMTDLVRLAATPRLTALCTNSWEFICCLASAKTIPPLRKLQIDAVYDLAALYKFVCRMSTLQELEMGEVRGPNAHGALNELQGWSNVDFKALSLASLPNLRRLYCPPHVAYLLQGPHNLEFISCSGFLDDLDELRDTGDFLMSADTRLLMEMPSKSMQELLLPLEFVCSDSDKSKTWYGKMREWFPNLKILSIVIENQVAPDSFHELFEGVLDAWGPQETLTELHFPTLDIYWKTDSNHSWFCSLMSDLKPEKRFPNLCTVSLAAVACVGTWYRADDAISWKEGSESAKSPYTH